MNILIFSITLLATLTFSFNATAITATTTTIAAVEKVEGGPRTIIQNMTDVVVVRQPTATNLYTTIVNSEGNSVLEMETQDEDTVISVEGLEGGIYTVETIDDNGDYQEFNIIVE
jgi:hypothetical protein